MTKFILFTELEETVKFDLILREIEILKSLELEHTINAATASLEKLKYGYDQKGRILFYAINSSERV